MEKLYDVVAVNMATNKVRIMASGKQLSSAKLMVCMAVARRGVDEEFFSEADGGKYTDGDAWAS